MAPMAKDFSIDFNSSSEKPIMSNEFRLLLLVCCCGCGGGWVVLVLVVVVVLFTMTVLVLDTFGLFGRIGVCDVF